MSSFGYSLAFLSALRQGQGSSYTPGNMSPAMFAMEACVRATVLLTGLEQERRGSRSEQQDATKRALAARWESTVDKDPSWTPRSGPARELLDDFTARLRAGLARRNPILPREHLQSTDDAPSGEHAPAEMTAARQSLLEGTETMRNMCLARIERLLPTVCDTPFFGLLPAHSANVLFAWAFGFGDGATGVRGEEVRAIRLESLESMLESRRAEMEAFYDERAGSPNTSTEAIEVDRKIALDRLNAVYEEARQEIEEEADLDGEASEASSMTTASGDKGKARRHFALSLACNAAIIADQLRPRLDGAGLFESAGLVHSADKDAAGTSKSAQDALATVAHHASMQQLAMAEGSPLLGEPMPF